MEDNEHLTDLQLVDLYIEKCRQFVNPRLFGQLNSRGLIPYVNFLPKDINEAKAVARARFAERGKFFGEAEIDDIAGRIDNLKRMRDEFNSLKITDVDKLLPILVRMTETATDIRDYFKQPSIP